jgi:hypothetical protein
MDSSIALMWNSASIVIDSPTREHSVRGGVMSLFELDWDQAANAATRAHCVVAAQTAVDFIPGTRSSTVV